MEAARYLSPSPATREMAPSIMEARLASLLDTEPDGIIVIDEQAHILVFNKACERLFGYSAKEVAGRAITLLMVEEEDKHGRDPLIGNAMRADDWQIIGVGREVKSRHRDGTIIPIELAIGVALTPDGRQFICVLRDLRQRQESDQRLAELRADLIRLGRLSAIDEMGLAIAHELNQPLTALLLYLQSMKRIEEQSSMADNAALYAMIGKAAAEAERASAIIHRIRKFVEKRMPERRLVDLPPLIDDAIELTLVAHRHKIRLLRSDDLDLPQVAVDPVQFQQIVVNLVRNAIEAVANREDAEIRVSTRHNKGVVELAVEDNGPGIPTEAANALFYAFSTIKGGGLGLGLVISQTIAQNHGGDLRFDPGGNGRGAKFILVLPLTSESAENVPMQH
jgi:two-component system sensor kinase FixL